MTSKHRSLQALCLAFLVAFAATARGDDGLVYLAHPPSAVPAPAHPPLIVLLHGSGADERDMIGLWHDLPDAFVVISPRAPFHDGNGGWRWYHKGPRQGSDLEASRKIVDLVVANAVKRFDADPGRIFVAGFSQGAVMTYELALHEPGTFQGAGVLSGILMSKPASLPRDANRTPFFVAHGTADPRIPFAAAEAGRDALTALGTPVAFHAYQGMGHTIGPEETRDLSAWFAARLQAAAKPH